jgi:hypothetical protein
MQVSQGVFLASRTALCTVPTLELCAIASGTIGDIWKSFSVGILADIGADILGARTVAGCSVVPRSMRLSAK